MIARLPLLAITLRGLLDSRRTWLMVLLAAVPVLTAAVLAAFSELTVGDRLFDRLMIQTVLPLIALVFGTAALGSELDDGTIVYLLSKPIRRARIVFAKSSVAAGLTLALAVPATVLTGLIVGSQSQNEAAASVTGAYTVAVAFGGAAYTVAFLALSTFTSRAIIAGLGYVIVWEGILSGLLPGTQALSIRQATLELAAQLAGTTTADVGVSAGWTLVVVILVSLALATWRLSRFQLRGSI